LTFCFIYGKIEAPIQISLLVFGQYSQTQRGNFMKNISKVCSLILALLMVALTFAACNSAENGKSAYEIAVENGLHARPAGALASIAKRFKSEIQIKTDKKEADSKRLLSIMTLGATKGTVLKFIINGEDENEAEKAIRDFCAEQLS
jgi:phosphocarrier protein